MLVACQGKKLRELVANANPQNDAEAAMVEVHINACAKNLTNHIIKKADLAALEAMQSVETREVVGGPKAGTPDPTATGGDDGQSAEPGANVTDGDGAGDKPTLAQAVRSLNPDNDEHWTQSGKPATEAVSQAFGSVATRKAIDEAAPGFDREAAKAAG